MRSTLWRNLLKAVPLVLLLSFVPAIPVLADDDPSRGMIRTLNVDGAWVQNTYYLSSSVDNNASANHYYYLYGEGIIALGKDLGVELDLPTLIGREPLGQGPLGLGPIGLNLRYVVYQFGTSDSEEAGVFSVEGGGAFVIPDPRFKFLSGSLTPQIYGGYRFGKLFIQGNYGVKEMVDIPNLNSLFAQTAVSYTLNDDWYVQTEANFSDFLNNSRFGSSWDLVPQVAFQTGDWLFEFGEDLSLSSTTVSTDLLVARAF